MCCTRQKVKLIHLEIISRVLAPVGRILHRALDRLNSIWYRFSVYCLNQLDRWPNQTTGELVKVKYAKMMTASICETWVCYFHSSPHGSDNGHSRNIVHKKIKEAKK